MLRHFDKADNFFAYNNSNEFSKYSTFIKPIHYPYSIALVSTHWKPIDKFTEYLTYALSKWLSHDNTKQQPFKITNQFTYIFAFNVT